MSGLLLLPEHTLLLLNERKFSLTTRNPDDEAKQNKGGSEMQNKEPGAGH